MSGRIVNVRPKDGYVLDGAGAIVPAPSNVIVMRDKLSNVMSGMGTTIDRQMYAGYSLIPVTPQQAEAAYRTSWLMRKIIDIPPLDMTREWRGWQAEKDDIEALERAERKFQLREKCKRALILARLWGGSAIIIGIKGDDPAEPLDVGRVRKDGLSYLHVMSRHQITADQLDTDPESEWFGHPVKFTLSTTKGEVASIHPSRVVSFIGQPMPEGSLLATEQYWGDPLYQSIETALKNADLSQDGFAALIDEAKIDILKIPDLTELAGSDEYETRLINRLASAQRGKSTWRALVLDAMEEWDQREVNWSGMPDIINTYLQLVAGAADIPVTRLLGQSPKGLQSTGEGEERDYHAMVMARQNELLAPALDRIDEVLIRSTLGDWPEDIHYRFNSLAEMSPKDVAEIEKKRSETIKTYADTALIGDGALADIARNAMIESGAWPGCEAAFEDNPEPDLSEPDPADLLIEAERNSGKEGDPASAGEGVVDDAAPPHRAEQPVFNVTVPVEVHMPKKGGHKVVVTKHDENGRIAEFEKREIDEDSDGD